MALFKVYHAKKLSFMGADKTLTVEKMKETHQLVRVLQAKDREDVFSKMNFWEPTHEDCEMLTLSKVHQSTSVGDVVYEVDTDMYCQCDDIGWIEVPKGVSSPSKTNTP